MAITCSFCGVWNLNTTFKKINSGRWATPFEFGALNPGEVWTWGYNGSGVLSQNNTIPTCSPVQIPGTQWIRIAKANRNIALINCNNELFTAGQGEVGALGLNDNIARSSPTQVPGSQWTQISAGRLDHIALKSDGTLWSWGCIWGGSLGLNEGTFNTSKSSPTQIPGTQWCAVGANMGEVNSGTGNAALKNDGTGWVWGIASFPGTTWGIPNLSCTSSPVQIPGTQWICLARSDSIQLGVKTDGSLWLSERFNSYGQLGQNDTIPRSSFVQVPGTWTQAFVRCGGVAGMKSDGSLWVWGRNTSGMLGLNDTIDRSSPTQLPGSWFTGSHSASRNNGAIKNDGTLWVWGQGSLGAMGLGVESQCLSSPTQIPGTCWCCAVFSNYGSAAMKKPRPT